VGLFAGTMFLGEHYRLLTWAGAAIIIAGVFITTKAQSQITTKAGEKVAA
ncbi:MAG: EamA/RhaT family transporter, partial [Mesorhizobium sp.]